MKKTYPILAIAEGYSDTLLEAEASAYAEQSSEKERPESRILQISGNVAVIEIKGALTNKNSYYNSWYNLVAYDEIREASMEAIEYGVGAILYDIDSPGGRVSGMKDVAAFTATLPVPTVMHTSGMMASAALFYALSGDHLFLDSMSEVGSVGVVMTAVEYSEALKRDGVHAEVFRSGIHKQAGNQYEKLSAVNRKYMKDQVMTLADLFYEYVSEKRGIPMAMMDDIKTGKTYIGQQAVDAGLADGISSFDQALAFSYALAEKTLDKREQDRDYNGNNDFYSTSTTGEEMKKTLSQKALEKLIAGKESAAAEGVETEKTPEELAAEAAAKEKGAEGAEPELTAEELAAEAAAAENAPEANAEFDAMKVEFDAAKVELTKSTETIAGLETQMAAADTKYMALETQIDKFKALVVEQVNSMRVALSLTKVDMAAFTPESVLTEHESMSKTFEASFVTSGIIPEESDDDNKPQAQLSRNEEHAINNTW